MAGVLEPPYGRLLALGRRSFTPGASPRSSRVAPCGIGGERPPREERGSSPETSFRERLLHLAAEHERLAAENVTLRAEVCLLHAGCGSFGGPDGGPPQQQQAQRPAPQVEALFSSRMCWDLTDAEAEGGAGAAAAAACRSRSSSPSSLCSLQSMELASEQRSGSQRSSEEWCAVPNVVIHDADAGGERDAGAAAPAAAGGAEGLVGVDGGATQVDMEGSGSENMEGSDTLGYAPNFKVVAQEHRRSSSASLLSVFPTGSRLVGPDDHRKSLVSRVSSHVEPASALPHDFCILSPTGATRLAWEVAWLCCFAWQLWLMPFELAFYGRLERPLPLRVAHAVCTAFFSTDIVLNFNTGYARGPTTVMQRRCIVANYLRCWFWVDLAAVAPLGLLLEDTRCFNTAVRLAKVPKALRALRAVRLRQSRELLWWGPLLGSDGERAWAQRGEVLCRALMVLTLFAFLVHWHACAWVALRQGPSAAAAAERYYEGVWCAYLAFAAGASMRADEPGLWTLEIAVASLRLGLLAAGATWAAVRVVVLYEEGHFHLQVVKSRALKHLRRHGVSAETRRKVLEAIRETSTVEVMRRDFGELACGLPDSLRRRIYCEMWERRIVSFGLIARLSSESAAFLPELCALVEEHIVASQAVIFSAGDVSAAAYYVLQGSLRVLGGNPLWPGLRPSVLSALDDANNMQDFTRGTWIGELALVNADLRQGATIATQTLSHLMAVPALAFHDLIFQLGLDVFFQRLCEDHLLRGICGRCGAFGDHIPSECPKLRGEDRRPNPKGRLAASILARHRQRGSGDGRQQELARGMREFLRASRLQRLGPCMRRLGVLRVEQLEAMVQDLTSFRDDLERHPEAGGPLTFMEEVELCRVAEFRRRLAEDVKKNFLSKAAGGSQRSQHLLFLSHYKVEAGTEAALMRSEIEQAIGEDRDPSGFGKLFDVPAFLDSEDLQDLGALQERVRNSHNLALLLTKGVLTRPWCLVEIVTAMKFGVPIRPVEVIKPGSKFDFPDEDFYGRLASGEALGPAGASVLAECGVEAADLQRAVRGVFRRIAVPYSPHRTASIRRVELAALLARCGLREPSGARARPS